MATAAKSAISPLPQTKTEPNANAIRFLDEQLTHAPASSIPARPHGLSHFRSMIVVVPKSDVEDEAIQKKQAPTESVNDLMMLGRPTCR